MSESTPTTTQGEGNQGDATATQTGEGQGTGEGGTATTTTQAGEGNTGDQHVGQIVMSQQEWNDRQAAIKRKALKDAEEKLATAQQLSQSVQEVLNGRSIEEVRGEMTELNEALKSAEQKAAEEAERAANRVATIEQERDEAIGKYETNLVDRKLFEAIGLKAKSESAAKLIKRELASRSKVENDEVFVKAMVEKDGVTSEQLVTPDVAVSLLEKDVAEWGYAFKSTVNGGAGGEVVDGVQTKVDGNIDWDYLAENPDKFMELQAKNPGWIDQHFDAQQRNS